MCRINYDNQKTQSKNTGVKIDGHLRVRRIVGDAAGTIREEIGNVSEVRRRNRRRLAEITEKARLLVKSHHKDWELAGSPSEEVRRKARRNKTRRSRLKACLGCVFVI